MKAMIRPILPEDDAAVAGVIRAVMPEFGADGQGFAIHDAEVDGMYAAYDDERSRYFVACLDDKVVGGAGVAPLIGGDPDTCELKKMYLLFEARGAGLGKRLLESCLNFAKRRGYKRCYLETLERMKAARSLYVSYGFKPLPAPEGCTGHFGCDRWYALPL